MSTNLGPKPDRRLAEQLMRLIRDNNDELAFKELYELTYLSVQEAIQTYIIKHGLWLAEESEDYAIQAFTKAWHNRAKYTKGDNVMGWIYIIALNIIRTQLRKKQLPRHRLYENPVYEISPDVYLYVRQLVKTTPMSAQERRFICLRYLLDWTDQEIAAAYGKTLASVRSSIRNAKQALKKAILQEW